MLLPAEAVVAQSLITPKPDFDVPAFWNLPSASVSEPWSRNTFVLLRADGISPTRPTDVSPSTAKPATLPAAAPAVPVPGTVQNLRWADEK
jgi:hypothetical protein